jgi:hypothetical protein
VSRWTTASSDRRRSATGATDRPGVRLDAPPPGPPVRPA